MKKEKKIKQFQDRLDKIRSAALWLDFITQKHTDAEKARKGRITVIQDDMEFFSEKLIVEKAVRQRHKTKLMHQMKEFDSLYLKAQEFIRTSDDYDKITELLNLLDEDQRSTLVTQYKEKTLKRKPKLTNFTADSFKKYESVKIVKFVETLQAHNLPENSFAREV